MKAFRTEGLRSRISISYCMFLQLYHDRIVIQNFVERGDCEVGKRFDTKGDEKTRGLVVLRMWRKWVQQTLRNEKCSMTLCDTTGMGEDSESKGNEWTSRKFSRRLDRKTVFTDVNQ